MSEFVYINPAKVFKNPKTGEIEDVRAKEIAHLKALKEQGFTVIGLEMTEPALAELCDRNIDPQHTEKRGDQSCAKEIAENAPAQLGWFKSKDLDKVVFVTNRVDVDSMAAYVLADRYLKGEKVAMNENIEAINTHDTAAGKPWVEPKPIEEAFDPNSKTGALAASIQVFRVTADNIADVRGFIDNGEVRDAVMDSFRKSQQAIIDKVKSGEIKTEVVGGIAYVESSDRAATNVGYSLAPVVVAENPVMRAPDGHTYRKISICQHFEGGYVDLKAVGMALATKEEGWGGNPTFIGSPQNQDCTIDMSDIKKLVYANLTPEYKAKVTAYAGKAKSGKGMND